MTKNYRSLDPTSPTRSAGKLPELKTVSNVIRNGTFDPPNERYYSMVRKDIEKKIRNSLQNQIKFYNVDEEREEAHRLPLLNANSKFKSIHNYVESTAQQKFLSRYQSRLRHPIEIEMHKKIRQEDGKLYLLQDINDEFSRDIEAGSKKEEVIDKENILKDLQKEIKIVNELEIWQKRIKKAQLEKQGQVIDSLADIPSSESNTPINNKQPRTKKKVPQSRKVSTTESSYPDDDESDTGELPFKFLSPSNKGKYFKIPIKEEKWFFSPARDKREPTFVPIKQAFLLPHHKKVLSASSIQQLQDDN